MELKKGYKQTGVGVIPEDWNVKPLGDMFSFSGGFSASRDQLSSEGYCYLHYGDIHKSAKTFIDVQAEYQDIPKLDIPLKRVSTASLLSDGDVVFVDASEDDEGASKHIVVINKEGIAFISGLHTIVTKSKTALLYNKYKRYCFQSRDIKRQFYYYAVGTKVTGISKTNISKIFLPVPPVPEQTAIATALSDTDALIGSLEKLISKKRNIKQGAMQELLTGRKRLPGFEAKPGYKQTEVGVIPEDWGVKLLPEVCRFRSGKAHEQHIFEFGQYVCVNSKFISTDGQVRKYCTANFCSARKDDVLIVMSDLPNGKALAKAYLVEKGNLYAVNQRVCALTAYRDNPKYLFYFLNRNAYFLKFDDGVNQTHLLNYVFAKCPVALPPTRAEQEAIATILSDMDADIDELEQKRDKYKAIKQGMMQDLLTGKTRLI